MMVIIFPVIPSSSVRASSGVPWKASGDRAPTLTDDSTAPAAKATSTDSVGSTHSDPRTYSLSTPRPTMPASAILILHRASDTPPASSRSVRLTQPLPRHGKVTGQHSAAPRATVV